MAHQAGGHAHRLVRTEHERDRDDADDDETENDEENPAHARRASRAPYPRAAAPLSSESS